MVFPVVMYGCESWSIKKTEHQRIGWHQQLNERGFWWTPGVSDGQGGLACCGSWGLKALDVTEQLK